MEPRPLKGALLETSESCKCGLRHGGREGEALVHRHRNLCWNIIRILLLILHVTVGTALSLKGPPLHQENLGYKLMVSLVLRLHNPDHQAGRMPH